VEVAGVRSLFQALPVRAQTAGFHQAAAGAAAQLLLVRAELVETEQTD
jgi:hypothetical protein